MTIYATDTGSRNPAARIIQEALRKTPQHEEQLYDFEQVLAP